MKKIHLLLVGLVAQNQSISKGTIVMQGNTSVSKACIILSNSRVGALESDGTNSFYYLLNLLNSNYGGTLSKYIFSSASSGSSTVPKTVAAIEKNGLAVTGTLNVTLTFDSIMFIVSKKSGAGATSSGNSLVYVANGINAVDDKNFNVYEVAQTIDALYTTLTT